MLLITKQKNKEKTLESLPHSDDHGGAHRHTCVYVYSFILLKRKQTVQK